MWKCNVTLPRGCHVIATIQIHVAATCLFNVVATTASRGGHVVTTCICQLGIVVIFDHCSFQCSRVTNSTASYLSNPSELFGREQVKINDIRYPCCLSTLFSSDAAAVSVRLYTASCCKAATLGVCGSSISARPDGPTRRLVRTRRLPVGLPLLGIIGLVAYPRPGLLHCISSDESIGLQIDQLFVCLVNLGLRYDYDTITI